jgi:hypothetical protein
MEPTWGISMTEPSAESIFGQAIDIQSDEDRAADPNEAHGGISSYAPKSERMRAVRLSKGEAQSGKEVTRPR